jgi:hypothetical protein
MPTEKWPRSDDGLSQGALDRIADADDLAAYAEEDEAERVEQATAVSDEEEFDG